MACHFAAWSLRAAAVRGFPIDAAPVESGKSRIAFAPLRILRMAAGLHRLPLEKPIYEIADRIADLEAAVGVRRGPAMAAR